MSNFFKGVSAEQDGRFGKADVKLINEMTKAGKFANILDKKVDFEKVNIDVISTWITKKITELLGFEDDIVTSMITNHLQSKSVNPKMLQVNITGFLGKHATGFMEELWTLLLDAQSQPSGIPSVFIKNKREEIMNRSTAESDSKEVAKSEHTDEITFLAAPPNTPAQSPVDSRSRRHHTRDHHSRHREREDGNKDRDDRNRRSPSRHRQRHDRDDSRSRRRDRSSRRSPDDEKRPRDDKRHHNDDSDDEDRSRRRRRSRSESSEHRRQMEELRKRKHGRDSSEDRDEK